ncbi:MAG: ATP-dependent helicase, partial [Hyphomicrobiales bacterium]|nr:ATP-dependent helicase [Hyphomicrobiales bacterium]
PRQPRPEGRPDRDARPARAAQDRAPQERAPHERAPSPERAPSQDRYQNDRGHDRRRYHEDNGPPVVGLGDHVPSFLLRPVILKPIKATAEAEANED